MLDWLIVGGGIHGTVIAHALLRYGYARADTTRIVDPHESLLAEWRRRAHNCGMRFLRSPAAHSLEPDFTALLRWADRHGFCRADHTIPPYARPSLELFNAHARATIASASLESLLVPGVVTALTHEDGRWRVTVGDGQTSSLTARRVVLAPGPAPPPRPPSWARTLRAARHVFADDFDREAVARADRPVVVGGGVSAAHLALFLAGRGCNPRMLTREPIRVHQFDSDPCFIGPGCMRRFLSAGTPSRRRKILEGARHPGSVPPELAAGLERALADGELRIESDEITAAEETTDGTVRLFGRSSIRETGFVALATGFPSGTPGRTLLEAIASGASTGVPLPTDAVGYPIPDGSLQWTDGLFVTGALAELELGPSARNIIGAHNAAKRIIAHLGGSPRPIPGAWHRYAPASVSRSSDSV